MRLVVWSLAAAALAACGGGETDVPAGGPLAAAGGASAGGGAQAGSGGVSAGAAGSKAGGAGSAQGGLGGAQAGQAGQAGAGPAVLEASFAPYAAVSLGGTLSVKTDRASTLKVEIGDGGAHAMTLTTSVAATTHAVPVLQLRAGRKYALLVTATDAGGATSPAVTVPYETPPLPADFPPLVVKAMDAGRDGLTLFGAGRWGAMGPAQDWAYLAAVDVVGEVVWYLQAGTSVNHFKLSPEGDVRFGVGDGSFVDVSVAGAPQRGWMATAKLPSSVTLPNGVIGVDVDTLHHDVVELPNGNLLALSTELRTIKQSACPATYMNDWDVVGDVVIELEPATGKVVGKVSMFDLLDPCRRVDQAFKTNFWAGVYGGTTADWTHANAVFYDAARNTVLVSLRHQDWVVAYRYADDANGKAGSLLYRLGPEGDFQLAGTDAKWNYQQHAARVLSNGNVMMYDNGSARPGTLQTNKQKYPWSRSLELSLDMTGAKGTWTATQVWDYGSNDVRMVDTSTGSPIELRWYSQVIGIADVTPANTVLAVHGALTNPPTGLLLDGNVKKSARIFEVTREATPKVVLDVRVEDEAGAGSYGVYRAVRVPSLYPKSSGVTAVVTKR